MTVDDEFAPDRQTLYNYKLDRILGKGGTGTVYRGFDMKQGGVVAVKLFRENFFRSILHLRDLSASVKRYRKFQHPNVVGIHDFIDGKEGRCMIMEYVDGPNLRWYLTNRPWNLPERLGICAQMCSGLQYLHDNKVVHHDFKPANVLFTRRGQVKITDFSLYGSSILMELFDKGAGEQVTPMFVAPEYLRKEKVGPQADQYALGVTMYMLFTEKVPFPVDNLQALYKCHLVVTPLHPTQVNPKCPTELGDLIMRLMSKHAKDRFQDCDQVRTALSSMGSSRI